LRIEIKNTGLLSEKIDTGKVRKLVEEIVYREDKKLGEIEIVFLKDQEILKINKKFLQHDYFTDVIAFSYNRKSKISGDLCIGIDSVSRNAVKYKTIFKNELIRVIIHGLLHLIGYNDKDTESKNEMKKREDFYLNWFELAGNGKEL
jgi:rRNA maturation RNase YbeY